MTCTNTCTVLSNLYHLVLSIIKLTFIFITCALFEHVDSVHTHTYEILTLLLGKNTQSNKRRSNKYITNIFSAYKGKISNT